MACIFQRFYLSDKNQDQTQLFNIIQYANSDKSLKLGEYKKTHD